MLKQNLSQKQLQKLSPQQIQLMKLLQVPTASLEQRIKEELEANPALDEGENATPEDKFDLTGETSADDEFDEYEGNDTDVDLSEYLGSEYEQADYKTRDSNYSDNDDKVSIPIPVVDTFQDFLDQQLGMVILDEADYEIAQQLIGSIDEDGYLRRQLDSIIDDLAFTQNIETTTEKLESLLSVVQTFEPTGVGARSLQECLLIQINGKLKIDSKNETLLLAKKTLSKYFESFSKKHYEKLHRQLGLNSEELKIVVDEILKLNPKPGSAFSSKSKNDQYIIPDFIVVNESGRLELSLNSRNAPDLKINNSYMNMIKDFNKTKKKNKQQKDTMLFIKQKIDSAKWFIDAIKQRQQTMLKTMGTILRYQYDYFLTGDEIKLKPMILKDIAELTHLDISTISRVSNSKYVQTEFGTFKLKDFFSESLTTDSGEEVSTREVKKILSNHITSEDKRKPLSDQKLTEALKEKGYNIARRTVAKYREQLNIPVARLRKEL